MAGAMAARIAAGEVKCISRCLGGAALRGELRHKEMLQNVCTTHRNMFDVFEDCKVTPCNSDRCGSTCLKGVIPCRQPACWVKAINIVTREVLCRPSQSRGLCVSVSAASAAVATEEPKTQAKGMVSRHSLYCHLWT